MCAVYHPADPVTLSRINGNGPGHVCVSSVYLSPTNMYNVMTHTHTHTVTRMGPNANEPLFIYLASICPGGGGGYFSKGFFINTARTIVYLYLLLVAIHFCNCIFSPVLP